jgi:hypothetical protein
VVLRQPRPECFEHVIRSVTVGETPEPTAVMPTLPCKPARRGDLARTEVTEQPSDRSRLTPRFEHCQSSRPVSPLASATFARSRYVERAYRRRRFTIDRQQSHDLARCRQCRPSNTPGHSSCSTCEKSDIACTRLKVRRRKYYQLDLAVCSISIAFSNVKLITLSTLLYFFLLYHPAGDQETRSESETTPPSAWK